MGDLQPDPRTCLSRRRVRRALLAEGTARVPGPVDANAASGHVPRRWARRPVRDHHPVEEAGDRASWAHTASRRVGSASVGRTGVGCCPGLTIVETMVRTTTPADEAAVIDTVVLAFASDPIARWCWPDSHTYHPAEPHWYLPLIGVDPAHQNNGHGAALMTCRCICATASRRWGRFKWGRPLRWSRC
jgi:GNAT superfamily N-acetyltransferase